MHSGGQLDAVLESQAPNAAKIATRTSSLPGTYITKVMYSKHYALQAPESQAQDHIYLNQIPISFFKL